MSRLIVILFLAALIGLPLLLRPEEAQRRPGAAQLVIVTPHNEQIRREFGQAFSRWCRDNGFGDVEVLWNVPGGTSEIRRMLLSQYRTALAEGGEVGGAADLLFGGGSYEFEELRKPIQVPSPFSAGALSTTVLAPVEFDAELLRRLAEAPQPLAGREVRSHDEFLREVYGPENRIGDDLLHDPDGHWFGTALSGFGIVYNRDALAALGVPPPRSWEDLADPRLFGAVALANPAQSGSITTAFEAILLRRGWEEGWRILRRIAANARSFAASSSRGPIDVASGDAAAGICIDFYGRFEAQAILDAGGGDRIGYVDPPGETRIDADPIAMLRGAPRPDLARLFIAFVLSERGQALWQLPPRGEEAQGDADRADDLGPERFELRRMPVRPSMYSSSFFERFVDQVNPFEIATRAEHVDRNVRSFIVPLFSAMAVDDHAALRAAWRAIITHPAYPSPADGGPVIVTAEDVQDPVLRGMLNRFDAMPEAPAPGGVLLSLATTAHLAELRAGWLREGWAGEGLWPPQASPADALRRRFRAFFAGEYEAIVKLSRSKDAER